MRTPGKILATPLKALIRWGTKTNSFLRLENTITMAFRQNVLQTDFPSGQMCTVDQAIFQLLLERMDSMESSVTNRALK